MSCGYTTAMASPDLCQKFLSFLSMYNNELPAGFLVDLFESQNLDLVFGEIKNDISEVGILKNNHVLEIPVLLYDAINDTIIINKKICKRITLN